VAAAGFVLGVNGGAEEDAIAVGGRRPDDAAIENPSGNRLPFYVFVFDECGVGSLLETEQGFHVQPVATAIEQNNLAASAASPSLLDAVSGDR